MTVTVQLMGGLGNQLFQIFTALAYAGQNGHKVVFLAVEKLGDGIRTTQRPTYWTTLFKSLAPFLIADYSKIPGIVGQIPVRESGFTYDPTICANLNPNYLVTLVGYFQSPRYFQTRVDTILRLLNFRTLRANIAPKPAAAGPYTVAMHFRLGDYKKYPKYHPILSKKYYVNALLEILNTAHATKSPTNPPLNVICFYDKTDPVDVISVEHILTHIRETFFESDIIIRAAPPDLTDWQELLHMSTCQHHVIANSSFSWWGAYLADTMDKEIAHIICRPAVWFGTDAKHDTCDLFPSHWRCIDC